MGTLTMSERLGRRRLRRRPSSRPRRSAASSKKVSAVSRTEPSRSVCSVLSPAMSVSLLSIEDDRAWLCCPHTTRLSAGGQECGHAAWHAHAPSCQVPDHAGTAIRRRWRSIGTAKEQAVFPLVVLRGVRLATGHATPLRAHGDALLDASVNPDAVIAVEERAVGPAAVRAGRFLCGLRGRGSEGGYRHHSFLGWWTVCAARGVRERSVGARSRGLSHGLEAVAELAHGAELALEVRRGVQDRVALARTDAVAQDLDLPPVHGEGGSLLLGQERPAGMAAVQRELARHGLDEGAGQRARGLRSTPLPQQRQLAVQD